MLRFYNEIQNRKVKVSGIRGVREIGQHTVHQNVNDVAFRDSFNDFFMASNFSMITICWLLTVDSEMAFLLFHLLAEGVLAFF